MTQNDLAELRRLWEETTPGEWALAWEDGKTGVLASMIGKLVAFIGNPDPSDGYEPTRKANGEFIAAAHNSLPALLDELEAARAELEALKVPLAIYERHTKLIGAAEEWELEAGIAKAAGRDLITYQREYLEQRAAKLRQEAEDATR